MTAEQLGTGHGRRLQERARVNSSPQYDPQYDGNRWVACFDLLGIRALISANRHFDVFLALADAQMKSMDSGFAEVHSVWFSDTFILYSDDNSASDFAAIHSASRWFMNWLTTKLIPVRGAMACGCFYADGDNHLFFGSALIESYKYGDSQDWIGFVLAPSAEARLRDIGLPPEERLDYARWRIPLKRASKIPKAELFACLFAGAADLSLRKPCIDSLLEMKRYAEKDATTGEPEKRRIVSKYRRTLAFLDRNLRIVDPKGAPSATGRKLFPPQDGV